MSDWVWVDAREVRAIHAMQLAEHGGRDGELNPGGIESAVAQPRHLAAYGAPDAADLAAAYAFGLARNHGFADGNKRIAFMAAMLFLALNGFRLHIDQAEVVVTVTGIAGGELAEAEVAAWFRRHAGL